MTRKQIYAILGIAEGASLTEVKTAYRKKAFELHPDLNPSADAGKRFQELNEAYVLMLGFLDDDRTLTSKSQKEKRETSPKKDASKTPGQSGQKERTVWTAPGKNAEPNTGASAQDGKRSNFTFASAKTAEAEKNGQKVRTSSGDSYSFFSGPAGNVHLSKEEVLSNVLRDPFARRVFEDIYCEIRHGKKTVKSAPPGNSDGLMDILPLRAGRGLAHKAKDWLRRQIDDEQTVTVPVGVLRPGMRIRLQVQQGMSGKKQNIEVTLPLDYTPGRPVRLRGLGRKIGPWLGDLYLRIIPKIV